MIIDKDSGNVMHFINDKQKVKHLEEEVARKDNEIRKLNEELRQEKTTCQSLANDVVALKLSLMRLVRDYDAVEEALKAMNEQIRKGAGL